jgi:hypothetical protein
MRTLISAAIFIVLIPLTVMAQGKATDWSDTSGNAPAILAAEDLKKADAALRRQFAALLKEIRGLHKKHLFYSEDIDAFVKSLQKASKLGSPTAGLYVPSKEWRPKLAPHGKTFMRTNAK